MRESEAIASCATAALPLNLSLTLCISLNTTKRDCDMDRQNEISEGFRLSPQQKHLWLVQELGYCPAYRAQCAILIEGNLNPSA